MIIKQNYVWFSIKCSLGDEEMNIFFAKMSREIYAED